MVQKKVIIALFQIKGEPLFTPFLTFSSSLYSRSSKKRTGSTSLPLPTLKASKLDGKNEDQAKTQSMGTLV